MKNFKIIGLTFLMLFSSVAFAQEKSTIVMTEAELESFLKTVADSRRAQLQSKKENRNKNELTELRNLYNQQRQSSVNVNREVSNYEILRELDRLNARLDLMNSGPQGFVPQGHGSSSTVVIPGGSTSPNYIPYQQGTTQYVPVPHQNQTQKSDDVEIARAIWDLERKLDSLKTVRSNYVPQTTEPAPISTENQEIADLKKQFEAWEQKLENSENDAERRIMLEELLAKFKNFKKQVFFANNSVELNPADYRYIQDVTEVLKQYPELSVVLEGWASTRGRADYNKQISMRRAEVVEQALVNNGISSARIVSSFRGEDQTSSEAIARRVDMSIILK